jgi:hypothetical protein
LIFNKLHCNKTVPSQNGSANIEFNKLNYKYVWEIPLSFTD